jgi:hypothetical protein
MMKKYNIGLVGIGKLGTAMMAHWNINEMAIGLFHPIKTKAEHFVQHFQNGFGIEIQADRSSEVEGHY